MLSMKSYAYWTLIHLPFWNVNFKFVSHFYPVFFFNLFIIREQTSPFLDVCLWIFPLTMAWLFIFLMVGLSGQMFSFSKVQITIYVKKFLVFFLFSWQNLSLLMIVTLFSDDFFSRTCIALDFACRSVIQ